MIGEDTACPRLSRTGVARERVPTSPEASKGFQQSCRKCHAEIYVDADTPKIGRREYSHVAYPPSRLRRLRAIAVAVVLPLLLLHLLLCALLCARERALLWEPTLNPPAAGEPGGIPRIIHQMYKSSDLPPKWADVPAAWRALHPPSEYTYMLWTDESLRELIATDYAWLLPTYDAYPYPTQRWDASRYAVLHKYGGLYADLDLRPVDSVDALLRGQTLLLPYTPNIGLTNAVMASVAGHPFLEHCMRALPRYASRWYHVGKHNAVLSSTGSTFVWAMHMQWARQHDPSHSARLLLPAVWGKCSYCDPQPQQQQRPAEQTAEAAETEVGGSRRRAALDQPRAAAAEPATGAAAEGVQSRDGATASRANEGDSPVAVVSGGEARGAAEARGVPDASDTPSARLAAWRSPFEHGIGSSWHSLDSWLMLLLFCRSGELCGVALVALVWRRARSRWHALCALAAVLAVLGVQRSLGIIVSEFLIGRPWIWLIMT